MTPAWERRFRAPIAFLPEWSPLAPGRAVYVSNEPGVWQVHAWDVPTGARRQVTVHPVGVIDAAPTLDGEGIVWFHDESGSEAGHWLVQPFTGGESRPLLDGVPRGWSGGLAQAPGIIAAGLSNEDGFAIYVSIEGDVARVIHRSRESVRLGSVDERGLLRGALSSDGTLLCIEHGEHGDLMHAALRVVDPRTGETIGEQIDAGMSLESRCWSPVAGDTRLALDHEREGDERPAIWDLASGGRVDLELDLAGVVRAHDWWPDGSALLLANRCEGRDRLLRYQTGTGELSVVFDEAGTISKARVRPDGSVWLLHERGDRRRLIVDDTGDVVLSLEGDDAPTSRPYRPWRFENPHGQTVHGFFVTPSDAGGPFPVAMLVHGGPSSQDLDCWRPEVQAYVDAGFAVGMVNYRGSTGYGREWRDALIGDIGGPELEDVNAGLRDLIDRGLADPERAVAAGWSWGGFVTLLELGKHADLWCCGVAGVPVGDYAAGYEDLSPLLQAYDRALLGGEPKDVPELMRDRSPINFADAVRAPVLLLIGENDSRCPYRQAMLYVEKLQARDHPHELYVFSAGHSSFDVDERVRQIRTVLEFLGRHVPGVAAPGASGD